MKTLKSLLLSDTPTIPIVDKFFSGRYTNILILAYFCYKVDGIYYNINLLIDRNYPKPPPPDTYRTTFTDLRSGFRSLNREKYLPPFADEIKNFFASHNVEEFKDKIISFNELYLLKAQASKEHYEIGFGDYWLFRIAGFVITDETRFSTWNGEMWRF